MSAHKLRVIVSARARSDLRSIALYGAANWGDEQSVQYRAEIEAVLSSLASFPELGRRHDDGAAGLRSIAAGEHMVYYRHDEESVTVLRILHRRTDPARHLPVR